MMSARDRYMQDPEFKMLVDYMENFIHRLQFTPSEMREAAMLASIRYEMSHTRHAFLMPEGQLSEEFRQKIKPINNGERP